MKKLRVKKIKCLFHGPSALTKQKPALSNWSLTTWNEHGVAPAPHCSKIRWTTPQPTFSGLTD